MTCHVVIFHFDLAGQQRTQTLPMNVFYSNSFILSKMRILPCGAAVFVNCAKCVHLFQCDSSILTEIFSIKCLYI